MSGGPPYRVLLVDGRREDRANLCRFLDNHEGRYQFLEAASGQEGLQLCQAAAPDCLLLEYWLPDMDGFEFVDALRALQPAHEPPIVMLTAQGSETVAVAAMAKGISDYVPKPLLTARALCRIVANVIDRATLRRLFDEQHRRERELLVEKDVLLKEVRHRVKNNLQVVISLLGLQAEQLSDQATRNLFRDTENRVRSMAIMHEMLYTAPDLGKIDLADYLRELTAHLAHSLGLDAQGIDMHTDVADIYLSVDTAIPCGLIVNELVSNALKHAFPKGGHGTVYVGMTARAADDYELTVRDSGRGLPAPINLNDADSLGLQLVATLVQQLHGEIEVETGPGTTFRVRFHEVAHCKCS